MKPFEMVQEFVKDKLMTDDTKFEVTKLVEAVIAFERERCAGIAESFKTLGGNQLTREYCQNIAQAIRESK